LLVISTLLSVARADFVSASQYINIRDLGGEDQTSEIQRQLISRFALLAMRLEVMEAAALAGDEIDIELFGRAAGNLRRLGEALGLKRVPRDISSLGSILRGEVNHG
jgi:hypothetical protein